MTELNVKQTLAHCLPEKAVGYCFSLWQQEPFTLRLSKPRHTKAGDFFCSHTRCSISINRNLSPCQFLITYIHEVAHLHVYLRFKRSVKPHGREWKREFRRLMEPLLTTEIFPPSLLKCLIAHMQNPKASTFSDSQLTSQLHLHSATRPGSHVLEDLSEGSVFRLRGHYFKKGKLRRTRFCCHEVKTKRNYLVPRAALVELIQPAVI